MQEYKGYMVECDDLNKELYFIVFADYDEAYEIMLNLNNDGYMVDLEECENGSKYVVWFNEQVYIRKDDRIG